MGREAIQLDTKTKRATNPLIDFSPIDFRLGALVVDDSLAIRAWDLGAINGTRIGLAGSKLAFYGGNPITKPTGNIFTALANLGLIATPSLQYSNLSSLPTTIAGYGITADFNSLGDARWAAVLHTHAYGALSGLPVLAADKAAQANQFLTSYTASTGSFTAAQPAFTDLAGTAIAAQIPSLDAAKIATGAFDPARIPELDAAKVTSGAFDPSRIPSLDAAKTNSGTFDPVRIPDLDAAKIASGTLAAARIPSLDAAIIATGAFDPARIPDLDAAKVTSGVFADARIPDVAASKTTSGTFNVARIPDLDAAKITSGAFAKARQHAATVYTDVANVFTQPQDFISHTTGSVTLRSLATPGAPVVTTTGVPGATTWSYRIVAKLADGTGTIGGATGSTALGNATLDLDNFNNLTWAAVPGAVSYDVYRTVAGLVPATLGKIANVAAPAYTDQGAAGDSSPVPASNSTGNITWLADNISDIGGVASGRPRDINLARNLNAGAAISAATAAILGNATIGGTTTSTGKVTGPIVDKGGQVFNVVAYGAIGDGTTLNYTAIQAAANAIPATGGTLFFPDGDWRLERTVLVKSGTRVLSSDGARIIPTANGSFTPISDPIVGGTIFTMFANANCFAVAITDTNITFENLHLGPVNAVNAAAFAIFIRKAQNVKVINSTAQYLNEVACFLGSRDTLVQNCIAKNIVIAAFDHWEGPVNAKVLNCTVADSPHAVLFNSEATVGDTAFHASNLLVEGLDALRCSNGAIFVAPLNAAEGSTIKTVKLSRNRIDQAGLAYPGIVVHSTTDIDISNNTFEGIGAANVISLGHETAAFPCNQFNIVDNTIKGCSIGGNTYISAFGTNGRIEGNRTDVSFAVGGTALHVDSPTTLLMPNDLSGASVELVNSTNLGVPTVAGLRLKANRATKTFEVTGSLTAANLVPSYIATQTLATPGTFSFTNIPAGFSELIITLSVRGTVVANTVAVQMTFNNDTGANYEWIEFAGVTQTAQTSMRVGIASAATAPGNQPGVIVITIPAYSASAFFKSFTSLNVCSSSAGVLVPLNEFGVRKNVEPVTRIDVFTASGGFATGSTMQVVAR